MSDDELVIAAQCGDKEAFYKIITLHSESLYNIAYCYLKDQHASLEAIQEVTCRAYLRLNKLKKPEYFKTWLTKILIYYCIDELKRRKKVIPLFKEEIIDNSSSSVDSMVIEEALERLEPKYKHVIVLKYFQDMTIPDIASVLECPEGTVKSWLYRALKLLRVSLQKEGDFNA